MLGHVLEIIGRRILQLILVQRYDIAALVLVKVQQGPRHGIVFLADAQQAANTPEFKAAAKVLKELIGHHVEEEERNIWAQVKESFSHEQREEMNREFLTAKKKVSVA